MTLAPCHWESARAISCASHAFEIVLLVLAQHHQRHHVFLSINAALTIRLSVEMDG